MARSAVRTFLGAAGGVLLAAAAASAQQVHEIRAAGDSVAGDIADPDDVDRLPVRLLEGSSFDVTLKAAKKSPLLPALAFLDPDRAVDPAAQALTKSNAKGNVVTMKKLLVDRTGLRWLEIRGAGGTTGGWTLATKLKLPKRVKAELGVGPGAGTVPFEFVAPGGATATVVVKASKGSAAHPAFGVLLDPGGAAVIVDDVIPGKTGFTLKNVLLPKPGRYVLTLAPGTGGDGAATVSAKWKVPKPVKRALFEPQIIVDPVVTAVDPAGADTATSTTVSIAVDFAEPGGKVVFRKEPTVVTVQGGGIAVTASGISFLQSFTAFQKGTYDVEVENPDGGRGVLPASFTVVNAAPKLTSVAPSSGFDNQVVDATVSGAFINGGATVSLERQGQVIPGTDVLAASTSLSCRFDLRTRPMGFWDVVVANPDAAPTTLAGAFEIRNSPPTVVALSPSDNLDASVVSCTIDGADLDATPSVRLRRTGQPDIAGGSVAWASGARATCTFDTTGAAIGRWDLEVTNPDGQSATLPEAFTVSGAIGSPSEVLAADAAALAPPAVCYNATRDEFLLAWVDRDSPAGTWIVQARRVDASGSPLGSKVSVSSGSSTVLRRDVAVAWNPEDDRYLVAWAEPVSVSANVGSTHPSAGYSTVLSVFARVLSAADLAAQGGAVQVSDNAQFPTGSGWVLYDFNNFRPSVCWDPGNSRWEIAWMQEWSTKNVSGYGTDDFDCIQRSLDPSTGNLGPPANIASTPQHEGEPEIAYDPGTGSIAVAFNYRSTATSPLEARLAGTPVSTDTSSDHADLRLAVDADAGRILLTWTRTDSSGAKHVEGAAYDAPSSRVGSIVSLGSGSGDHFLARPLYNPDLRQAQIAWTRLDASGDLSVRVRRATTGGTGGLALLGPEKEASGGSGDEAAPVSLFASRSGESVVFWMKTMTFDSSATPYAGAPLAGFYSGTSFWIQRYR